MGSPVSLDVGVILRGPCFVTLVVPPKLMATSGDYLRQRQGDNGRQWAARPPSPHLRPGSSTVRIANVPGAGQKDGEIRIGPFTWYQGDWSHGRCSESCLARPIASAFPASDPARHRARLPSRCECSVTSPLLAGHVAGETGHQRGPGALAAHCLLERVAHPVGATSRSSAACV